MSTSSSNGPGESPRSKQTRSCATGLVCHRCDLSYSLDEGVYACPQCGKGSISSAVWDGGKNLYVAGGATTLLNGQVCGGSLQDLDPATGNIIWQDCLPKTVLGALTLVPGVIALVDSPSLSLFNAKMAGPPLFTSSIDKFYGSPAIANGVLYSVDPAGFLVARDPATGLVLKAFDLGGLSFGGVSAVGDALYVAVGSGPPPQPAPPQDGPGSIIALGDTSHSGAG